MLFHAVVLWWKMWQIYGRVIILKQSYQIWPWLTWGTEYFCIKFSRCLSFSDQYIVWSDIVFRMFESRDLHVILLNESFKLSPAIVDVAWQIDLQVVLLCWMLASHFDGLFFLYMERFTSHSNYYVLTSDEYLWYSVWCKCRNK